MPTKVTTVAVTTNQPAAEPFDHVASVFATVRSCDPVAAAVIGGCGYLAGLVGSPFMAAAVLTLFVGLTIAAVVRK